MTVTLGGCSKLLSVTFTDPEGWFNVELYENWEARLAGYKADLSDTTQNAVNLTGRYKLWYWYKV